MFNFFKKKNKTKSALTGEKQPSKTNSDNNQTGIEEKEVKIDENITVHTMPERFRFSHTQAKKTKKTGFFIVVGGAVFLVAITIGLYYYFLMRPTEEPATVPPQTDVETEQPTELTEAEPEPEPEPEPVKSAKEVYLIAQSQFDRINNFSSYEQVIREYGSKNRIVELERQKNIYNNLSVIEQVDYVSSLINSIPKSNQVQNIQEIINGDTVTLSITIKELANKGEVIMVLEDGWKLESENWPEPAIEEPEELATSTTDFIMSNDSDNDGLTDKEEELLASLSGNSDSDGDGYNDLAEVMSLYNPTGPDRLINNPNISKYLNNSFNYSLLYPASWTQSTVGGDESVMFKSSDNQFIQVIAQANQDKETISNWYRKQFNLETVSGDKLIITDNWQGIKSEEGLTIYLTDKEYNNIIIITYIPGQDNKLDYINIFEMVIKSLEVM